MKKKLILLGIHLTVVALVLILTMVTLAWYTQNDTVEANNAVITAEPQNNLAITEIVDNIRHYSGETGLGGRDEPYIATKILLISQESKYADDAVTCFLKTITVKLPNGDIINESTDGFNNILEAFTYRVRVVEIDGEKQVTNEKGVFYPSESGILVDNEKNELHYQDKNFFTVVDGAYSNTKTCSTYIQLELIFLDEESYNNYTTVGENAQITPFRFSSYDYMGSTFSAVFSLGKEEGSGTIDPNA